MDKEQIKKDRLDVIRTNVKESIKGVIQDLIGVKIWWSETECVGECLLNVDIPFVAGCFNAKITFAGIVIAQFHVKV